MNILLSMVVLVLLFLTYLEIEFFTEKSQDYKLKNLALEIGSD